MLIYFHCFFVRYITVNKSLLIADLVFHSGSSTKEVYEEGLRDVALSVFSGINCEYRLNEHAFSFSSTTREHSFWNSQQLKYIIIVRDRQSLKGALLESGMMQGWKVQFLDSAVNSNSPWFVWWLVKFIQLAFRYKSYASLSKHTSVFSFFLKLPLKEIDSRQFQAYNTFCWIASACTYILSLIIRILGMLIFKLEHHFFDLHGKWKKLWEVHEP